MSSRSFIRLATAVVVLVGGVSLPAQPADAGAYYVRSCFPDGIDNTWSRFRGNEFADAYSQCPQELVARNVKTSTPAPGFSNAKLYVNAPPGTYIDEIHFDGSITTDRGWWAGLFDAQNGRWIWCGGSCYTFGQWLPFHVGGFATGSLEALVFCAAAECRSDGMEVGYIRMRNVTLRLQDVWDPSVAIVGGSLASGGWKRGVQTVEVEGSDNTGVAILRAYVDGLIHDRRDARCDDHLLVPCPASRREQLSVDLGKHNDGAHTLEIQAIDGSGNAVSAYRTVLVDNSPPDPVQNLTSTADQWSAVNKFDVRWKNPVEEVGAPVAGVNYRFCPESSESATACGPVAYAPKAGATSLSVSVPSAGAWRLQLWLVDQAGNQNDQTAREVALRWDPEPPSVALLDRDEDDPARINVKASDTVSGLASTELELRRDGDSTWHSLAVERTADGFTGVVDDEAFPPGNYAVRARARDRAGNEKSTATTAMSITLPVRLDTELAVGKTKLVRAGAEGRSRVLVRKPRSRYGRTIRLTGRLTSPGGNPLAARDVEVFEQLNLPGAAWRPIATVRTGRAGRFRFKALPGPSRFLRFRYAGSPTIQGATSQVELRIRAASGMRVSRHRVVNGDEVMFRGRVRGEPIPPTGKLLQLQVYSRGSWLTFATPRANARGRWRYRYRFTATRGVTRYRFRVRLPRESGYPFEPGTSRTVRVEVIGL